MPRSRAHPDPHYPSIKPELVELTAALHGLAHDEEMRRQYLADAAGYAERFRLPGCSARLSSSWTRRAMAAMGVHPLVPFLANMQSSGSAEAGRSSPRRAGSPLTLSTATGRLRPFNAISPSGSSSATPSIGRGDALGYQNLAVTGLGAEPGRQLVTVPIAV